MDPGLGEGMEEQWTSSNSAMPQPHSGAALSAEMQWKDTADFQLGANPGLVFVSLGTAELKS